MAGAREIVSGPSFTPLPYGLWDAAQKPSPASPHWQNGITWEERCDAGATIYDECIAVTGTGAVEQPPAPESKSENVDKLFRGATPVTVFTEYTCSPVGTPDLATIAAEALTKVENWWIERAFWTGTSGGRSTAWPHLAADASVLDPQGVTLQSAASVAATGDAAHALGAVEGALADCYHGQGVIHMPPEALPTFVAWDLVEERDGALYTAAGNRVVVGTGYTGSSPTGTAAADQTSWIYATGAVFGYQGEVRAPDVPLSFDRSNNTVHMLAERTYVLAYECCLHAALVNLGVPT